MKSFYDSASKLLTKFFKPSTIIKIGFNISPMYRRSTAKILSVSENIHHVKIVIPLSYKNKNYVGTIFGGSLFSATDPIFMIQLINILGNDYVIWDKSSNIRFKRPANQNAFVDFIFTTEDIDQIKNDVAQNREINITKTLQIVSKTGTVFAEVDKVIYISSKEYYKEKLKQLKLAKAS
jgi:acyl-coenzyme A thioesterase PaaI-like protein